MDLRKFEFTIKFHFIERSDDLTSELDEQAFKDAITEDIKGALLEEFYGTELKDLSVEVVSEKVEKEEKQNGNSENQ